MARRRFNVLAFAAGLANGYFAGKRYEEDGEHREKLDEIASNVEQRSAENHEHQQQQRLKQQRFEAEIAKAAEPTYTKQTNVNADNLTQALPNTFTKPDSSNPSDTMSASEKAQHFIDNATPAQQANYGNELAKADGANNTKFIAGDDSVSMVDKSSAIEKQTWQVMQDQAAVYLRSGKPEHQTAGYEMLTKSQALKSENYQQSILEARKRGVDGLLSLVNDHDNGEMPYTELRAEMSPDGAMATIHGKHAWTRRPFSKQYDVARDGALEDQLTQELMALASPENMTKYLTARLTRSDAGRKADADDQKLAIAEKKLELAEKLAALREDGMNARTQAQIDAADRRARSQNNDNRLTPAQEANNAEISLARRRLTGMTSEEVKARSSELDASGRKNPLYDPTIAKTHALANQRMVGADPTFDQFAAKQKPIKGVQKLEKQSPRSRFYADPAMQGSTLGKLTTKGWEVRDKSGKLSGYWN